MNGILAQDKGFIRVPVNRTGCTVWDLAGSVGERGAVSGTDRLGRRVSSGACFPRDPLGDRLTNRPHRAGRSATALCFFSVRSFRSNRGA